MRPTLSFEELITQLAPTLTQLETERQAIRKRALIGIFLCFFAAGAISATVFHIGSNSQGVVVLILGGAIALGNSIRICYFHSNQLSTISTKYKNTVISRMVKVLLKNGQYSPGLGIPKEIFNESGLFEKPDHYSSEDLITGKRDKTEFRFAEVQAMDKRAMDKTDEYENNTSIWPTTIFKGFMFVADFHKHFAGHTTVSRNSLFKFKRGRVRLENPEFEKRFDVFSDDQVEARYLLTPSMMERIVELDKRFKNGIVLSFRRSNMMIFLHHFTNHFEVSLWSTIDNKETLFREYSTISALIAIVDELNLNTRIWTKK